MRCTFSHLFHKSITPICGFAVVFLFACTAGDEPATVKDDAAVSNALIPLEEGNYWVYETITGPDNGDISQRDVDTTTMKVVGSRQIKSKDKAESTWYEVFGFMVQDTILLQNRQNGLWMIDKMGREVHYYRTDIGVGETHTRPPAFNVVLQDSSTTIQTKAGKFDSRLYNERFGNAPSATSYYFADGVGLVEWVASNVMMTDGQNGSVRTTLIDSNLK